MLFRSGDIILANTNAVCRMELEESIVNSPAVSDREKLLALIPSGYPAPGDYGLPCDITTVYYISPDNIRSLKEPVMTARYDQGVFHAYKAEGDIKSNVSAQFYEYEGFEMQLYLLMPEEEEMFWVKAGPNVTKLPSDVFDEAYISSNGLGAANFYGFISFDKNKLYYSFYNDERADNRRKITDESLSSFIEEYSSMRFMIYYPYEDDMTEQEAREALLELVSAVTIKE